MCTVTFVPRGDGFYLAMNRDERIARRSASAPAVLKHGGVESIYPIEGEGGTWIAINHRGVAFTLLNWNDTQVLREKTRTRGIVIPALAGSDSSQAAQSAISQFDLEGILPFRLVGFFPAENLAAEWRWNQGSLTFESLPWKMRQWCSSSLSDAEASLRRGLIFEQETRKSDYGSLAWLRRLHASHDQEHYPFSHCVHRGNVETLSYSEVVCTHRQIEFNYVSGCPCRSEGTVLRLSLARQRAPASTVDCASLEQLEAVFPFFS